MGIRIVTDSTAYLKPEEISRYKLEIVPLVVSFGEETFKEGEKYTVKEYYHKLKTTKIVATTSQPSSGEFFDVYQKLYNDGHEIISIHISSVLSGTLASAQTASSLLPDAKITIIDSLSTSCPLAWMATEAAKAAEEGKTADEIVEIVESIKEDMNLMFVVDTLEYLKRGGRIGGAQALMGNLLQIKPILHLQAGRIEVSDKVRTKQKALTKMIAVFDNFMAGKTDFDKIKAAVLSADAEENVRMILKELVKKYPQVNFEISEIGPVIGSHAGPGTLGISFSEMK